LSNKFLIILLAIFLVVGISTVSASDDAETLNSVNDADDSISATSDDSVSDNLEASESEDVISQASDDKIAVNSDSTVLKSTTKETPKFSFKNMSTNVTFGRNGEWFNVTLLDSNNNPLAGKSILIGFNGKVYNKTTNASGVAQLQINIGYQSANTFALTFMGDDDYEGIVDCAIIVVNPLTTKLTASKYTYKSSAKTKTLKATLKQTNGTLLSGKKIVFTVNGNTYVATTNSKGVASVTVSLSTKKTYTYTAKFAGNNQYKTSSASNKVVIK